MADEKLSNGARLIQGSLLRVLVSAISAVVGFFMMPFLISHLGEYWYGIWVTIGSLLSNFNLLDLGLTTAVVRYVTEALSKNDADAANQVISTAFWIFCLIACLLLIIVFVIALLATLILKTNADTIISTIIFIVGISMVISFPFKALAGILHSKLRYDLLVWLRFGVLVVSTGLTIYLLLNNYGLISLAIVGLLLSLGSDIVFFFMVKSVFPKLTISWKLFHRDTVQELFSFSIWTFIGQLSNQVRLRTNELVVAGVQSAIAVTRFSVGSRPSEIAYDFLYQATNIVQPVLTRYHVDGDHERMRSVLLFLTKINVAFGGFVGGMLLILGEPFIMRWMGEGFSNSSLVLYIIAVAMNVEFMVNPLDNTLYAVSRPRFLAIANLVDAVANLGLSIWLGIRFGLVGVALGTLIPMICTRFFLIVPYTCKQASLPVIIYVRCIIWTFFNVLLVLAPTAFIVQPFLPGSGYGTFTVIVLTAGLIYAPVIFYCAFSLSERDQLLDAIWTATKRFG